MFLDRIEIRKCEQRQSLLFLVRRKHRLESFRAADADLVVLFELGRRRIFVPTTLILYRWRIDAIEVAAP